MKKRLLLVAALLLMGSVASRADTITLSFTGVFPGGFIGSPFAWSYGVSLSSNVINAFSVDAVPPASRMTIFDFAGATGGTAWAPGATIAADWFFAFPALGSASLGPLPNPPDSPAVPNPEATYTGAVSGPIVLPAGAPSLLLGTWFIGSIACGPPICAPGPVAVPYVAYDKELTFLGPTLNQHASTLLGPAAISEPAALLMLGIGLLGICGISARKNRGKVS